MTCGFCISKAQLEQVQSFCHLQWASWGPSRLYMGQQGDAISQLTTSIGCQGLHNVICIRCYVDMLPVVPQPTCMHWSVGTSLLLNVLAGSSGGQAGYT